MGQNNDEIKEKAITEAVSIADLAEQSFGITILDQKVRLNGESVSKDHVITGSDSISGNASISISPRKVGSNA